MPYAMIVLAKQVPDTKNITGQAMKEDGTVNRSALPAIFNPEDLNALEMALSIRDRFGGRVTVLSMGPPAAAEIMRDALMRGADDALLLCDKRFAAADTLATAYALNCGIRRIGPCDIILCGRQAIDGDTAQTGPQVAGRIGIPQVTYVEEVRSLSATTLEARRNIEGGYEIVRTSLPALLTVVGSANESRPPSAKRLMHYKKARTASEVRKALTDEQLAQAEIRRLEERGLLIREWTVDCIDAEPCKCGLAGSPTRVMKIQSIVLTAGEQKRYEPTRESIAELVKELVQDHALG